MNQSLTADLSKVMDDVLASGLLVSLCTIQQPSGTLDASGQPDGHYSNVAGLVAIECISAPYDFSDNRVNAMESKSLEEIMAIQVRHVLLKGYYPAIDANVKNGWRAVIDGTVYDLLGSESDSQSRMTRIKVRIAAL
jgi:hypothetical protein